MIRESAALLALLTHIHQCTAQGKVDASRAGGEKTIQFELANVHALPNHCRSAMSPMFDIQRDTEQDRVNSTEARARVVSDGPVARPFEEGLLPALTRVYGEVLRRQGRTTTPFVRWSEVTGRGHEFAWLGGIETREVLLHARGRLQVRRDSALFDTVQKMHATATLNPYEREVLYGYPYVIGRRDGETVRGPLLTISVRIEVEGDGFLVHATDDVVHFNALPFKAEGNLEGHEQKIARVIDATPAIPLDAKGLEGLAEALTREFRYVHRGDAALDGRLVAPPAEPRGAADQGLWLVDQAALFVAPKSSYFLASDLARIGATDGTVQTSVLAPLLGRPGAEAQVDLDDARVDSARQFFPFPSNRSQRRAAVLVDDATTRVIRVEGPPGTGKSLTIANLACHLAATGKTVLISSQKDKAMEVVDAKLRELGIPELPMTLLHRDGDSKKDLLRRLEGIKTERGQQEVGQAFQTVAERFGTEADAMVADARDYSQAVASEEALERAHRAVLASGGVRRWVRQARFWHTRWNVPRRAPRTTDTVADATSARREFLLDLAVEALQLGRELAVSSAHREERAVLRELAAVLRRDQTQYKNFSLFDRLKGNPDRAAMLLNLLPVWIMTPDDVARLFPCAPGLFDVVIVDEASQVDLPSMMPIAYRGKKLVVFGDSSQMQPQRFAFVNQAIVNQAWREYGMDILDEDRWLHPSEQSLLKLATVRAEEEVLLDEHFRSLPPIIRFSNERWYHSQLRIMTDEHHKKFGRPDQPIMELHHVANGAITNGSQENETEALAVVDYLAGLVTDPDYDGASIGVMCLFKEQVALVQDLVAERIPSDEWEDHELVVINPDGFQGDERDVILYSLSYDANIMPQAAISERMSDQPHRQGMLNVAFTRARDEVHVFHSAPIESFTFANGRPGALTDWLRHCAQVQATPRATLAGSRLGKVDSQFETDVATALRDCGLRVLHQYPACGFNVDLVAEREEDRVRVAVECDGERYHLDEHGLLKTEDIERQAILERAGWRVVRIPYRKWLNDPRAEVTRVITVLNDLTSADDTEDEDDGATEANGDRVATSDRTIALPVPPRAAVAQPTTGAKREWFSREQAALLEALKEGCSAEEDVYLRARDLLGSQRLTQKLRRRLHTASSDLARRKLAAIEDGEYSLLPAGRETAIETRAKATAPQRPRRTWRQLRFEDVER
ncbi:MAG: ATP-binding protein [Chloroflexi bacterium]|nr:ATP-binding protein [Chloroflexota bacterium]